MFANVFDALAKTSAEAANMNARADLIAVLAERVNSWGLPQEVAAARLAVTRSCLIDLFRGKLGKFSLDALVNPTARAGLTLEIRIMETA